MIEQIMFFLLGACLSALATIALLPLLWRRAVRLTRARLAATLPLTPDEIAAAKDQIRAAHVVQINRAEAEVDRAEAALQAAKAEIGARIIDIQAQKAVVAAKTEVIAALERDLDDKRLVIAGHEATILTLERERDNLITNFTASRIANQGMEQEAITLRLVADQRQARIGELDGQVDKLAARLADALRSVETLKQDLSERTDALRETTRHLRDAESEASLTQRKLAAAEALAADRQRTIDETQAETLRLIEESGRLTRERDHERIERGVMAGQIDSLNRRHAEFETALAAARSQHSEIVRDLSRTVESLRQERRAADEDLAALKAATAAARPPRRTPARAAKPKAPAAESAAKGEPA